MSLLRRPLRLRPLVVSLLPLLTTSPLAHAADGPAPTELEAVRITGSRIPRASARKSARSCATCATCTALSPPAM
jgi:hypothetical protein